MKQKTDLHQSLSALTVEEFDANPPKAIRPLTPPVECAECERLWAENEALTKDLSGSAVRNINLMIKLRDMADLQAKNEAMKERLAAVTAVYERYEHLDYLLCDQTWIDGSPFRQTLYDVWQVVRGAAENE